MPVTDDLLDTSAALEFFFEDCIDSEIDREIEKCISDFDLQRKKVTGKHQALPGGSHFPPVFLSVADTIFAGELDDDPFAETPDTHWVRYLDVLPMGAGERQNWERTMQMAIERQDLTAILEAAYWAAASSGLNAESRRRLLFLLYRHALDTPTIQHLLLRTIEARHEPSPELRQMSLDCLLAQLQKGKFRTLPTVQALSSVTDPQQEPSPRLREMAWLGLSELTEFHSAVCPHLFQSLWQQREPAIHCRQQMLRLVICRTEHPAASEAERFEGLYLLQRILEDRKEPISLLKWVACQLLQMQMAYFPDDIRLYVQEHIWPLCQRHADTPAAPPCFSNPVF